MNKAGLSENERLELEAIRRRADRDAHGHISHALRLQLFDDVATMIAAVGGALIMAVSSWLIGNDGANRSAEIAVALIASTITLVAIWQAIWQPAKRSRNHHAWSTKFLAIEDNCRLGLAGLTPADTPRLMKELLEVFEEVDLIPERRWKRLRGRSAGK
jgi:hypothetical protein